MRREPFFSEEQRKSPTGRGSNPLPVDEFSAYKPTSVAEQIAMEQIRRALGKRPDADPLPAAKEICDRTEGRAPQHIAVSDNGPVKVVFEWVDKGLAGEGE